MSLRRMRPEQRRDFKVELSRNTNALLRPKGTQNSPDQEPRWKLPEKEASHKKGLASFPERRQGARWGPE